MKSYHSIDKNIEDYIGKYVYAFDKLDGSNFRAEWNQKLSKKSHFTNGFGKFGTRSEMIKKGSNPYCEAIDIFKEKYSESLDKIFRENKIFRGVDTITVYGEFFGDLSFAGQHNWLFEESFDVVIFDMFLYKKDFLKPKDFIDTFEHLGIPKIIFEGILDETQIDQIKSNIYNLNEGVVIKGVENGKVFMVKLKTNDWIKKVREIYGINNTIE